MSDFFAFIGIVLFIGLAGLTIVEIAKGFEDGDNCD